MDLCLADQPEDIRVLAIIGIPADGNAPIPGSLQQVTQIIGGTDSAAGIQFRPAHAKGTSEDFGYVAPKLGAILMDIDTSIGIKKQDSQI